ncbi:hypothetical protein D3C73_974570 [compost metagenome]
MAQPFIDGRFMVQRQLRVFASCRKIAAAFLDKSMQPGQLLDRICITEFPVFPFTKQQSKAAQLNLRTG